MTNPINPFVLQFQKVGHFGLPFHGIVRNTSLLLPDSTNKTWPYLAQTVNGGYKPTWIGGEAIAVVGGGAEVHERTAGEVSADASNGYNWKPYALLTGVSRNIGADVLGEHAWLYHDGNVAWKLRATIVRPATDDITIKIWLSQLFGYFSDDDTIKMSSERLLCSIAYVPRNITSYAAALGAAVYGTEYPTTTCDLFVSPKRDGSAALISVGFAGPSAGGLYYATVPMGNKIAKAAWWGNTTFGDWTYGTGQQTALAALPLNSELNGVLKVTVSGTGSLAAGSVGNGITAAIEEYKTYDDLNVVSYTPVDDWRYDYPCDVGSPYRAPWRPPTICECDFLSGTTTTQTIKYLYSYDSNDEIVFATLTRSIVMEYTDTPTGDCFSDYERLIAATHGFSWSFAGQSVDIEYTSTGGQTTWPIDTGYIESSWTWNAETVSYPPVVQWDSGFGDRTVSFVEFCWNNSTLYSYYISPGGTKYAYETAVSELGSVVPYPTIIKLHGWISNHPVDDNLAYAGSWPDQVFWI